MQQCLLLEMGVLLRLRVQGMKARSSIELAYYK